MDKESIAKIIKNLTSEQYDNLTKMSDEEFYNIFGCDSLELMILCIDDWEEGYVGENELYFIKKFVLELKQRREISLIAQEVVNSSCDAGKTKSIKVSLNLLGKLENKLNEVQY